jgi:hypothetical protein
VLNSFIIDREKGIIVSDIQQALHNVEVHKKQLFKDVYDYFTAVGKTLPISAEDLMTKSVSELINLCKEAIHKELSVGLFSGSDLQSLYEDGYNSPESDKQRNAKLTLTAYGSWLALNHFDNFIKMTVGDTIIINPSSK